MPYDFQARVRRGDRLIGPVVSLPSPEVADLLSRMGFDYLWIDVEHSSMGMAEAQRLIQAAGGRCPCVIRVPEASQTWLMKALDTGCDGVVIPQIRSASDVREAVAACLYPPAGRRGVGIARAHGYGLSFSEYVEAANLGVAVIIQIEHIDALSDIDGILAIPGVTALLVGPYDLSSSMGILGQVSHPRVQDAIERTRSACAAAGVPVGIFAGDAAIARDALARGFTLIALGTDAGYLINGARAMLEGVKG